MALENEHRLLFRDAMANLSAAVNIVTTDGEAGRCGLTATAVCSVTDTPPTLLVCINQKSSMNEIFNANKTLCVNILSHEQQQLACHFAGMTDACMEERFSWDIWQQGPMLNQPQLTQALASLEGEITQVQSIGTHNVYLAEIKNINVSKTGHGLIYFKRDFHPVHDKAIYNANIIKTNTNNINNSNTSIQSSSVAVYAKA